MEAQDKGTETLSTIKFDRQTSIKMDRIALKLGRTKRLVFAQMVEYFYRSKKDPMDVNDELLKNTLLKQHRDYIGFIRTQENDLLIPIKREIDRMTRSQKNIVDFFNGQQKHNKVVLEVDRDLLDGQKRLTDIINLAIGSLDGVSASLATKETLKDQFRYILESYIRTRDSFGMMTSTKEKEELVRVTRKQIDLL